MRLTALIPAALAVIATALSSQWALATLPYTQSFSSPPANWFSDSAGVNAVSLQPSGGAVGGFAQVTRNTQTVNTNDTVIVFRDQSNFSPTDSAFFGDWIGSGINQFSAYVYQNTGFSLPYFVRFAAGPSAGVTYSAPNLVPSGVWTQLAVDITPGQIGASLAPETDDPNQFLAIYNSTFGNLNRIQVGFSGTDDIDHLSTAFNFGLDEVSIGVPEPASSLLLIGAVTTGLVGYRRRRK